MSRFNVPFGFYDGDSDAGRALLEDLGLGEAELPVLIFRFRPGSPAFEDPSDEALADAFGVNDTIEPDQLVDVAIIGAGPAGLAAAVYGASEGLDTLVIEPKLGRTGLIDVPHPELPGLPRRHQRGSPRDGHVPPGLGARRPLPVHAPRDGP